MIPELHISKFRGGFYEARLLDGSEQIFESTLHESITDAIRDVAQEFPEELSEFLEVRYVDVSIGTQALSKMKAEAGAMADLLVELAAVVWQSEEEREARTRTRTANPSAAEV